MIGKIILNYRVTSLLGQGGMGSVYLAEHTLISKEKVAIKVINADMANDFTRSLLRDEAEHLAGLNHPNIVAFKNYHIDESGNIYLIMEYAEGSNLEEYIRSINGLVVEDRVFPLFGPILDAVGYAHKKNILHRDIKPANVVITTEGTPKILDFGIAKIIKNAGEEDEDKFVMGTPSFMSPEQVRGEHLDQRSDIYSLGVLLHQMMTGNPPYDTTTLTEQEINDKVVNEQLPRIRTFYKYVSDGVQKVVDKATAKNPEDRYQSCEEFKKALHRAIYPPKMPLWTKIAIALAAVLVVGVGFYIWDYNRVKTYYYKDYVPVWGVPQGIGEVSASQHKHMNRCYRFIYQKRKLLRMSLVNCYDNIIYDNGSQNEYLDRQLADQYYYYDGEGNVNRVVYKNSSGKSIRVDQYIKDLSVVAFQWDDEYGTEKRINNADFNTSVQNESGFFWDKKERSSISRVIREYDDNGYCICERYADINNQFVPNAQGVYGERYTYDEKGRIVAQQRIDIDGNPASTPWGLSLSKVEYDQQGNMSLLSFFTIDGNPSLNSANGVAQQRMEYDEYGNATWIRYYNENGDHVISREDKCAGWHNEYDDNGLLIRMTAIDADNQPMYNVNGGSAIVEYKYDARGYDCEILYFDIEHNPCACAKGYHKLTSDNDEAGNPLNNWFYDAEGNLCKDCNGVVGIEAEYDSIGNQTKLLYFNAEHQPAKHNDGWYGIINTYNSKSLVTSITYLGPDHQPGATDYNIIMQRFEYDVRGNTTKVQSLEADGTTLRLNKDGFAELQLTWDDYGNMIEADWLGADSKLVNPVGGYAKMVMTYDENGYLSSAKYFNADGTPFTKWGYCAITFVNDRNGNVLEEKYLDQNGKIASQRFLIKRKYDDANNLIEDAYFNNSGATNNSWGVHKCVYKYNSSNQCIETAYYDTSNRLTNVYQRGIAIERNEYNALGQVVKTSFFNSDNKPCIDKYFHYSVVTNEYDNYGNVIKECHFDAAGKPVSTADAPAVQINEYDNRGNLVYFACQDGDGNYVLSGWYKAAIVRQKFDDRNNRIERSFYDTKDQPILCAEGYQKEVHKFDEFDRLVEGTCYDVRGNKCLNKYGVHLLKRKYAEGQTNPSEEAFYNTNGQPTNNVNGIHRIVMTYTEDGTPSMRTYYNAAGAKLGAQRFVNDEWVNVQPTWQELVQANNAMLPMTDGPITIESCRVTGSRDCEVIFRLALSKGQLNAEEFNFVKEYVNNMVSIVEANLGHVPYVTGELYDVNNELIYSYRK